eukprot:6608569-Pyramimonas_sp.AAC.1
MLPPILRWGCCYYLGASYSSSSSSSSSYLDFLIHRLTDARTYSYSDLIILTYSDPDLHIIRPTHTHSDVLMLRLTHTQSSSDSDFLIVRLIQHTVDLEGVSGGALFSAPLRGAARGCCTVPFGAVGWGCLKRFASFLSQHPLLSEQIWRMSRARRSSSPP